MPQNKSHSRQSESGNVFLFILLGVVLFAALIFTVSRGFRSTTTSNLSSREADLAVSDILAYAQQVERSINRLRRKGCSENEISFENDAVTDYDFSTRDECKLFDGAGAGLTWRTPAAEWMDSAYSAQDHYQTYLFTGGTCVNNLPKDDGASCNSLDASDVAEIVLFLPYISYDICVKINKALSINEATNGTPGQDNGNAYLTSATSAKYKGSFTGPTMIGGGGYDGKNAGCFEGDTTPAGGYAFYYALLIR